MVVPLVVKEHIQYATSDWYIYEAPFALTLTLTHILNARTWTSVLSRERDMCRPETILGCVPFFFYSLSL